MNRSFILKFYIIFIKIIIYFDILNVVTVTFLILYWPKLVL